MKTLIPILFMLLLTSCSMQKYCNERFPPALKKDSIMYVDKIVYRDTTVYVFIQGDTIRDTVYLDTVSNTARSFLSTDLASSIAYWDGHRLLHELSQKDSTIALLLENAIKENSKEVYKDREVVVKENFLTAWQNFQIAAAWVLLVILLTKGLLDQLPTRFLKTVIEKFKKKKPP